MSSLCFSLCLFRSLLSLKEGELADTQPALERIIKKFINQKESVTSGRAHLSELRRRILEEDSKVSLPPYDLRGGGEENG